MKHLVFEENGDFKAASVMTETPASLHVELPSGRRTKIKAAHVLLRFDSPAPEALMPAAQRAAEELDISFLWECAPSEEFGFLELAHDYFGAPPSPAQALGLLLRLHGSPVHFHRKGRGRFRPAPAETVAAALAALERRRAQEAHIERLAQAMTEGTLPEEVSQQAARLLFKPDKSGIAWRALELALKRSHQTPERLLLALGAFNDSRALHLARFAAEHFPAGLGFDAHTCAAQAGVPGGVEDLPLTEVQAFSIDDSSTTEIDDALSVSPLDKGGWRVGIHIAAPGLGIDTDSRLDLVARERMSSVYMPGEKITMLPDSAVSGFSLDAGREVPVLSLYLDLSEDGVTILNEHSRIERIRIAENLRHDLCEHLYTETALTDSVQAAGLPFGEALAVLWRLTLASCAQREAVRGKPEPRFRTDFSFRIERNESGERVSITPRRRDQPLDRIVAEMMILANSRWGGLLEEHGVAAIYRSQQAGRVRMSTQAAPHEGLGVAQYIWSTSPLRRYVDLVNQRQLIALLRAQRPPLGARDAALFSIITGFESRHGAYVDFQQRMERLWCLRWVTQERLHHAEAVVLREDLGRLARAPLYLRLTGHPELAPGRRVMVALDDIDELNLSLSARYLSLAAESGGDETVDPEEPLAGEPTSLPESPAVLPESPAAPEAAPRAR